MSLQTFTELAGIPIHYDRYDPSSGYGYGTRGKPFKPRATAKMIATLQSCFADILDQSPFGSGEVITSAGAFVDKPGHHGLGQAFDLDGVFWNQYQFISIEYPSAPHLYLAIESIIRQHFGTVLNYNYNAAHQDHLHMDLGSSVGFQRMSKSRVEYLQASLFYVHGYQVGVDGVWGPSTEKTTKIALKELDIGNNIGAGTTWREYLKATASQAFKMISN